MIRIKEIMADAMHLFYPHICTGCGSDLLSKNDLLCLDCIKELPHTNFACYENNPIEKVFTGRIRISAAHSEFYFSKGQLIQQLIHQLKYKSNIDIGIYLGEIMGNTLVRSKRFSQIDYLIPLPLYPDKEARRGYNQAGVICSGIYNSTNIPVMTGNVIRRRPTETQTRKHRVERWQNVEGSFIINDAGSLAGKHVLLVDDVITTGATLEACGQVILQVPGSSVSLCSLAHASK